jgi:N-acetylmuramic acid 6-phosphate (MurNAc-6-P) etherase
MNELQKLRSRQNSILQEITNLTKRQAQYEQDTSSSWQKLSAQEHQVIRQYWQRYTDRINTLQEEHNANKTRIKELENMPQQRQPEQQIAIKPLPSQIERRYN